MNKFYYKDILRLFLMKRKQEYLFLIIRLIKKSILCSMVRINRGVALLECAGSNPKSNKPCPHICYMLRIQYNQNDKTYIAEQLKFKDTNHIPIVPRKGCTSIEIN